MRTSFGLILISLTSLSAFYSMHAFAGNGSSRGGGNALVCFSNNTPFPRSLNDHAAHEIPDEELKNIVSIAMLDLNDTSLHQKEKQLTTNQKHWIARRFVPPFHQSPENTHSLEILETEYQFYIGRYQSKIPEIYTALKWAESELPLEKLSFKNGPVVQLTDFTVNYQVPEHCMISTLFNQWHSEQGGNWEADQRLYFHEKNSFLSQVTALIHERVYYIDRYKFFHLGEETNSFGTYFFTRVTLTAPQDYREVKDAFNGSFEDGSLMGIPVSLRNVGFNYWLQSLFNAIARESGNSKDPKITGPIYEKYRPELMACPLLDESHRKTTDQKLTRYFVKGIAPTYAENFLGWPVDITDSELLPATALPVDQHEVFVKPSYLR